MSQLKDESTSEQLRRVCTFGGCSHCFNGLLYIADLIFKQRSSFVTILEQTVTVVKMLTTRSYLYPRSTMTINTLPLIDRSADLRKFRKQQEVAEYDIKHFKEEKQQRMQTREEEKRRVSDCIITSFVHSIKPGPVSVVFHRAALWGKITIMMGLLYTTCI